MIKQELSSYKSLKILYQWIFTTDCKKGKGE